VSHSLDKDLAEKSVRKAQLRAEQKILALRLRADGLTLDTIAQRLRVTATVVRSLLGLRKKSTK